MNWLRYNKRFRRCVIVIANRLWPRHNKPEWLLNWLYPDECEVTFE